jgi:hypothetical protein
VRKKKKKGEKTDNASPATLTTYFHSAACFGPKRKQPRLVKKQNKQPRAKPLKKKGENKIANLSHQGVQYFAKVLRETNRVKDVQKARQIAPPIRY